MLKRTARQILAWSVVFAMLFSLTAQPAAAADVSADTSAVTYSAQLDEDAAAETTEEESAEEETETDPADDSGEADESADASVEQPADESAEESAEEAADESGEEATLTVSAAAASEGEEEEEEEAYATVTASAVSYDDDGFYKDYYEPATLNSDGYYEIDNAGKLFWFAALVNGDTEYMYTAVSQNTSANAKLMCDIDLDDEDWTPIGDYYSDWTTQYGGIFDGQGYTIENLYIKESDYQYQALFGVIATAGVVKNVTVDGYVKAQSYVGGIAGFNYGTISCCVNMCEVSATKKNVNENVVIVGGIAAVTAGNYTSYKDSKGYIENCLNLGEINNGTYTGGIVGKLLGNGYIINCCNIGEVDDDVYISAAILGYLEGSYTNEINNYYLDTSSDIGIDSNYGEATSKTAEQFASGEVAYLLNGSKSGGTTWYQNIDNRKTVDSYPVLDSSHGKVYYGYTCDSSSKIYTNMLANSTQGHSYDSYGFCTKCGSYQPATQNSDGAYEISNAGQMYWFSALVNGLPQIYIRNDEETILKTLTVEGTTGKPNPDVDAVLTKDIDLSVTTSTHTDTYWYAIGSNSLENMYWNTTMLYVSIYYSGTFDGQGHTISGLETSPSGLATRMNWGLFGYVVDGTVKNLTVDGTVSYGMQMGGIVGALYGGTVDNCCFTGTVSDGSDLGGIVGDVTDGGTVTNCYCTGTVQGVNSVGGIVGTLVNGSVTNCYNTGTVSYYTNNYSGNGYYMGGVVGRVYSSNGSVTNCYNTGAVSGNSYVGGVVGSNSGTVTNCYYLNTLASDSTSTAKTAAQFASGEVAYLLNESVNGGTSWYQNIDNGKTVDSYPVLSSSHGTVYTYTNCLGVSAYSNTEGRNADHQYDSDGFCSVCGAYEPATLKDGVYQISNAGNLFWFAALVNGDTTQEDISEAVSGANAVLTADIDLSVTTNTHTSTNWTPIGNYVSSTSLTYTGTFDGDGHTISGLYINGTRNYQGLFGCVGSGGTVQNVAVSGSVTGFYYVGGVVGYNYFGTVTGCTNSATIKGIYYVGGVVGYSVGTVTNSYNIGKVASSNSSYYSSYLGGVVGMNRATVTNCYSTGAISGYQYVGGVVGGNYNSGCTVTSCYSTGEVSGTTSVGGLIGTNSGTVTNCYYLDTVGSDSYATAKTSDEFASGEVAYLLSEGVTDGTQAWYQNLDNGETVDTCPVLDSTHGTVYCGYTSCTVTTATYSNTKLSITQQGHSYDEDGFCTVCGEYEPATLKNGVYQISNAGNLFWFAALVNGDATNAEFDSQNKAASAVLTCDIDLGDREWTPIGNYGSSTSLIYTGTFDGGGYTISGLSITTAATHVGLFGYMNGTVQDLTVEGSIDITGTATRVGGVVGEVYNDGATISHVTSRVDVTVTDTSDPRVGGVVGSASLGQIEYCVYEDATVTVIGSSDCIAGVVGYIIRARIYDCANLGTVDTTEGTGNVHTGGVLGYCNNASATIVNSYNYGAVSGPEGNTNVGAVIGEIKSGSLKNCYYLDTSASAGVGLDYTSAGVSKTGVASKTADEFASGEVTYLLNGSTSTDVVWYQTLGTDAYPVLDSTHKTVYCGYASCSDTAMVYGNDEAAMKATPDAHQYGSDGICTVCKVAYQPAELENGVYQITNIGNLYWFSALVNGDTTQENVTEAVPAADAALTCDLDLSGYTGYIPIGYTDLDYSSEELTYTGYTGTFDGQGHTISNLTISNDDVADLVTVGLFGTVSGTVRNLGVESFTFDRNGGADGRFGAVVGQLISGGTVRNCYVANANIGDNYIAGAVAGCNYGGTIENCFSYGCTINANKRTGNLVGDNENDSGTLVGELINCYSDKTLVGTSNTPRIGTVTGGEGSVSAERFASGEVAYLLNGSSSEDVVWYQTLDTDKYPTLDDSHGVVYQAVGATCADVVYSNDADYTGEGAHSEYDSNGFCTVCGAYEPATLNSNSYYEIETAGNLFWFAALVNGYSTITVDETEVELEGITEAVPDAKAILTADIDLGVTTDTHTSNLWTPIGDEQAGGGNTVSKACFKGTFDGDGHTISNLTINSTNDGQGLFGYISGGTVKNLTLKDVDITGAAYVAAVVGTIYGGSITDVYVTSGTITGSGNDVAGIGGMIRTGCKVTGCYNAAAVTTTGSIVGGITGDLRNSATISNCYNAGAVTGAGNVGGIAGYVSTGQSTITNCHNVGTLTASGNLGGIVGLLVNQYSGETFIPHVITNDYYLDDVSDGIGSVENSSDTQVTTAKTSDEFASGEVAWLLQNGQSSQVWGQALTGDANKYPVLTSDSADNVVQVALYLVKSGAVSDTALQTRYINYNTALDEYPKSETTTYSFYTDEACTKALDTTAYTYTTDTTVYVKSTVTATVCVNGAEKSITVEEGETYDLTELVPIGYLYGGAFTDSSYETVIDTKTCGSGKAFIPQAGETYYVKLVDDSYFMIRCLLAYEHYVPTNLWLVTNIDTAENYKFYGFDITVDGDSYAVTTDTAAGSLETSFDLDGKTYNGFVDISDFTGFSDNDIDESGKTNLVGCVELGEKGENKFASLLKAGSFTVVPFFVTADGVKVTGAVNRTITLASGTTSVDDMYNVGDVTAASETEVYTGNTANTTMLMSASLNVVSSMYITNITDENTDTDTGDETETETETEPEPDLTTCTITVHDGDKVSTLEVDIGAADVTVEYTQPDGCLFAGWFTDEDYTTAADFSEITGDMTVYAKYVSSDYMQVKASTVSSKGVLKSIRMISATDSKNYAEVGFVYTYSDTEGSATAKYAASISGKTAKNLYGGGVGTGSKLIYADLSISGMEADTAVTITPYWVTLDGTTVYGTERTITYTGSGIE